jgi:predicted transcriptional regulator of viral defense system
MPSAHPMPSTPSAQSAVLQLARTLGLLRTADVVRQGLPTVALTRLVATGQLERVARGVYAPSGLPVGAHRSLAEVALQVPRGVVCLLSALRLHGMGTQAPFEVWLALPQGMSAPRLKGPALRLVRMSGDALVQGVQRLEVDGVQIAVFNPAKTIADCFKHRNKIGLDVALEALRDGWQQRKVTMDDLFAYAAVNRMANVMRPYLESLVA